MNIPIRLIAILPMLLLAAALIATACESATPDDASRDNAVAAAAPTRTPTATATPTRTPVPATDAFPTPQPCQPGEISVPIDVDEDGTVYIPDPPCIRLPSPTPTPRYPKLDGRLNQIVEALAQGISAQQAAGMAALSGGGRVEVDIYLDRDPRELVIWLNDNGAEVGVAHLTVLVDDEWPRRNGTTIDAEYGIILLSEYLREEAELEPSYEGGETSVSAGVPVSLLLSLSQRPGVLRVVEYDSSPLSPQQSDVPPAPQEPHEPVTSTPTPRATSQALSAHGATSWHQAGYKGSGVKIGIIDVGFEGFRSNDDGGDLPVDVRDKFASFLSTM